MHSYDQVYDYHNLFLLSK